LNHAISEEAARKMRSVLVGAVQNGTGKNAQSSLYSTAGKTSSAYAPQSPQHEELGGERGIAGFVGFAPAQNPRLVVYVGIIEPTNSYDHNPHGNEHAAPVFKEVIETLLSKMNVASDIKPATSSVGQRP
jgi:cell division protein FtsI/penicillin-binding protein 2